MTRAEMCQRLAELKIENLSPLAWGDLFTERPDAPLSDADRAVLDAYFGKFVATQKDKDGKQVCLCCRRILRSGLAGALLGGSRGSTTLEWSLAHGEAHCRECGWPYRVYHRDIGGAGDDALISFVNVALAVHPSGIQLNVEHEEEADALLQAEGR